MLATVVDVSERTRVPTRAPEGADASTSLRRRVVLLLASLVAAFMSFSLLSPSASAQDGANSLQSITPADGASLETSPEEIVLVFNQEIGNTEQVVVAVQCNLEVQDIGLPQIDVDGLIVTVTVLEPFPKGACSLTWFLRDAEGNNIVNGSSTFSILNDPPVAPTLDLSTTGTADTSESFITVPATPTQISTQSEEPTGTTDGALWLGRMLSTLSILVVFGSLALISVGWPEGPEYIVTVRFLRLTWIVGLLGTVLYVAAFSADFAGGSFSDGLNPSSWLDLVDAGWPGRAALLRLLVVIASGWVVLRPERIIDPTTAMYAWGVPGIGLIAVAMSRSDGPAPFFGFLVGIVHVFAVAIWFGGAALVARVILAGPGEEDLVQATKAFSKISVPAMLFACVTGVVQMIRLDGGDLFSSSHGRVVLLKALAVAGMLFVALAARQQVALRLDRAHELSPPMASRFQRAFTTEAAIGVVALMFSSWLVSLDPARLDPLADEEYLPPIAFVDPVSGIDARVSIGPGVVGRNGIKIEVDAPETGISSMGVRLIPPPNAAPCDVVNETGGCEVTQQFRLSGWGTEVVLTDPGVPLGVPGTWTLEFSAVTQQGVLQGATNTFLVRDVDGSVVTNTPTTTTLFAPQVEVSTFVSTPTQGSFANTPTTQPAVTTTPSG